MSNAIAITALDAAAILIVLAAMLGYLNHRFLGLPQSVGRTVMGAIASLIVVGIDRLLPASNPGEQVTGFVWRSRGNGRYVGGFPCFTPQSQ